jgi:hypothetical protein
MSSQAVADVGALSISLRDRESRRLIEETIATYRGGALRSAIMSVRIVDQMTAQHGGKTGTPYSDPSIRATLDAA